MARSSRVAYFLATGSPLLTPATASAAAAPTLSGRSCPSRATPGLSPALARAPARRNSDVDQKLRAKICQLIAGIVVADDDLDEKEDAFVDRLLDKFAIPGKDRSVIFPIVDPQEAAAAMRVLPAEAQEEALGLLVEAAAIDGRIAEEERAYLKAVARVIGVADDELEKRIVRSLARASRGDL
ncbi:MAG: hypothetical protein HY744_24735 [Deltaproteobacteria bacterium]|nr:hypothetical protein [Deltaproteobacteria bacterium]